MIPTGAWQWHHTGIAVADIDETLSFLRKTLGAEVAFEARGMTDLISQMTGIPGLRADLVQCRVPYSAQYLEVIQFHGVPDAADPRLPIWPGRAHTAYLVPDINLAIEHTLDSGGAVLGQITEFSEGRAVYCQGPDGMVIEWEEAKGEEER